MPKVIEFPRSDVDFKDSQLERQESPNLTLEIEKELGRGDNSIVYQVVTPALPTGPSALKVISKITPDNVKIDVTEIREEVAHLKKLNHRHILDLKAAFETESEIFLMTELCEYGTIRDFTEKSGNLSVEPVARILFLQLLSAVNYLHSRGVYHEDLFPQNTLLAADNKQIVLKLSNFGWAKAIPIGEGTSSAGEINSNHSQIDLRQLPMVLHCLVGDKDHAWPTGSNRSRSLMNLLDRLKRQLKSRNTLLQISDYVNHEWFRSSTPFPESIPLAAIKQVVDFSGIDEETSTANRQKVLKDLGLLALDNK
ncbi:hypothetical protein MJO28_006205 [Puccinia striiformis f. sp. tritici]|uniref:Uncharacterized protein n=1 Tax=Puccinia striiformis f. sp. tritici TaxID=168172 RepID=A0ACC0EGG5_9BASI|nr:hypothetical protein Pst134EB_012382 [Puccinia striiformis f. sp. tritici]KAI7953658.1 hypothetical protein MJO28_006205 [Puccinia striiformis f. sp. tritici]KAI9609136.1 hypothetical protein KEM48_003056 [Puccinia striiformis f. sp. tritici PST-130]